MAEDEELELLVDNQQLQLLGQGTYGCAFYPEISCKTHHLVRGSAHHNYLSKIQIKDDSLQRELEIGQRIVKRLVNYRYYVAPIIESCPVQLANLRQNKIKQCNVLTKANLSNRPIVSSKVPYLGKLTLEKYFHSLFHKQHCSNVRGSKCVNMSVIYVKKLVNTYLYLVQSYQKLNDVVGVVHLDVKADNIMYDAKNHVPVIIDFGLSYCIDWLQLPAYLSFKYPFGIKTMSYSPWCIEVSMLTHLARYLKGKQVIPNNHGGYLEEALLKTTTPPDLIATYQNLCVDFVKNNITLRMAFTDADRQIMQKNLQTWITNLAQNKTLESLWTSLLSTYREWDQYALALTYLYEMQDSGLLTLFPKPGANVVATPVWNFVNQLKRVILSAPDQRPKSQEMFLQARALFARMTLTNYQRVVHVKLPPQGRGVAMKKAQHAVQQQPPPI